MATAETARASLRDQIRTYSREYGDAAAGIGLWLVIAAFTVWAFIDHRDALATGIVVGSIFALGALGITLIYGILKFGHFAHGDSMMLSAYIAFLFLSGLIAGENQDHDTTVLPLSLSDLPGATDKIWNFSFGYGLLAAIPLAAVIMAAFLIVLDRLVYAPLRRRRSGIITYSIASLGLALVIRSLMLIFWGADARFYSSGIRKSVDLPFDIRILYDHIFIFSSAIVLMALVYLLLYRTKLGKAMRAMSDNADLARVSGINTDRIVIWTWAVSGALVAVAGVMLALQAQLKPELGFIILLGLFASAILGGVGKPQGALVGGFIIGAVQEVSVSAGFFSPGYKFSIAALVLIAILLIRPAGLFGGRSQ
jgi:branched-chain amino acid transport system permease protein/neutral amino acid transport system permease protein